ncbi:MAG: ATP-binding cassette domain-containing protein [Haloarculaceae archaeon]
MTRLGPDDGDASRSAETPLVDVRDVTVGYGDLTVLNGVSLGVASGELVGLVGPNGAGKTTLLKAINGVLDPDGGTVSVDGDAIGDLSSRAASRRVATVPQDTTVAFDFSVEHVVEMGRTPYRGRFSTDPGAADAVERALKRTDTARFRDRSVGSLSGGERQRVVLARALAQETPALLLDEPTASLDINHQIRTLELVRDLADDGKAALAAIHDLDLAARFCDRVAVLVDGDLLAAGPPGEVLTDEHLRAAFDTAAAVHADPVTGTPTVTPLSGRETLDGTVHVAGSGRPAARAIGALVGAGATVTAGVLPEGDLAAATAAELGVETVTAPAFAPVDARTEAAARDLLAAADVAVLAGRDPPAVAALVRDHDRVVRVDGGGTGAAIRQAGPTAADGSADGADGSRPVDPNGDRNEDGVADAVADPSSVVETVRTVRRTAPEPSE